MTPNQATVLEGRVRLVSRCVTLPHRAWKEKGSDKARKDDGVGLQDQIGDVAHEAKTLASNHKLR